MADDDLDPADWLSSQFGGEPEPEKPQRRRGMPAAEQPAQPEAPSAPYTPPAAPSPAPPAQPSGGGFAWGLTPGGTTPEPVLPATPVPPAIPATPVPAEPAPVESAAWDIPTQATPVQRSADPPATVAFSGGELARQEFPGFGAPVDSALDGVTERFDAQPVGIGVPADEGLEVSALDSLFDESSFVEYEDSIVPVLPTRASAGGELVVVDRPKATGERAPIPQLQKVLMAVAGGLVAVLLLIVLFLAGQKIAANAPAPAVVADPTPSASAGPVVGPVVPGEYSWDRLLGGECLSPFVSPWEDTFTVVDCAQSHPAQLLAKGTFPATDDPTYPGVDALQTLAASLCAVPTVIDYAAAAAAPDIQILSSFAADEADWDGGNRTYYCFASRTGGAEFTGSIAKPQVEPTAAP